MEDWRERTLRATVVLLVTSVALVGPGFAGLGASAPLTGALVAIALVLVALRAELSQLPTVAGHDLGQYARDLWLGVALAAVVLVVFRDASPAEVQALGGFAGFVGMVNYFLRPLYLFVLDLFVRLGRSIVSSL